MALGLGVQMLVLKDTRDVLQDLQGNLALKGALAAVLDEVGDLVLPTRVCSVEGNRGNRHAKSVHSHPHLG